jgi:PLP dependent protein
MWHLQTEHKRDVTRQHILGGRRVLGFANEWKMVPMTIAENLERVREQIASAAARAQRKADEITLIGVSKTRPAEAIREAYTAGLRHFGENRVQEWEGKRGGIADLDATWHLIGHLQSNKALKAARIFHSVDSVDDFALAQKLARGSEEFLSGQKLRVLIEVHVGGEESKSGAEEAALAELAEGIKGIAELQLAGLMCIPPYIEDAGKVRPYFAHLRELRDGLQKQLGQALPVLSMGMSHDFEAAILEGATEVRVGTAIFGARAVAR